MKINFRKLFYIVDEHDHFYKDAIVVFDKKGIRHYIKPLTEEEYKKYGYGYKMIYTRFRCNLRLDLWFIILNFTWYVNAKNSPK